MSSPPTLGERSPLVIAEVSTNHHVLGSRTETSLMSSSDPTADSLFSGEEEQHSQILRRRFVDESSGVGTSKKRALILTGVKLPTWGGEGSAPDTLVKKLEESAQQQSTMVGQLQSHYGDSDGLLVNKDEEITLLKAQLEAARAEIVSANNSRRKLAEEKISLLAQVSRERGELSSHRSHCDWALRYLQRGNELFEGVGIIPRHLLNGTL